MFRKLAPLLGLKVGEIQRAMRRHRDDPLTPVTIKTAVRNAKVLYLLEHQAEFPGVELAQTELRRYDRGDLAAQLLGYVSEISPEQLKQLEKEGYAAGDRIGQTGIESAYDLNLRGTPGISEVRVDALGQVTSDRQFSRPPEAGYSVKLTLDAGLQRAAESALAYGVRLAHNDGEWAANGGAIVAMNPNTGEVLALASNPTFDPSVYVGRVESKDLKRLADAERELPDAEPRRRRPLSAGLHLQAGHCARRDPGGPPQPVQPDPVHRPDRGRSRQADLQELGSDEERADDADDGARELVRHLLLRGRPARVRAARLADPEVGAHDGLRRLDRDRRRSRVGRARADAGLAQAPFQGSAREGLDERRLGAARHRPGRPARDAAPDDAPLRDARERRQARRAARRQGDRAEQHGRCRAARRPPVHRAEAGRPRHRPGRHPGRPGRALRRDARLLRDLHERVRRLPVSDLRQDRHGGEVRPAARLRGTPRPVVVVRLGPVRESRARRLRADRERRPRRRPRPRRRRSSCSSTTSRSRPAPTRPASWSPTDGRPGRTATQRRPVDGGDRRHGSATSTSSSWRPSPA